MSGGRMLEGRRRGGVMAPRGFVCAGPLSELGPPGRLLRPAGGWDTERKDAGG